MKNPNTRLKEKITDYLKTEVGYKPEFVDAIMELFTKELKKIKKKAQYDDYGWGELERDLNRLIGDKDVKK